MRPTRTEPKSTRAARKGTGGGDGAHQVRGPRGHQPPSPSSSTPPPSSASPTSSASPLIQRAPTVRASPPRPERPPLVQRVPAIRASPPHPVCPCRPAHPPRPERPRLVQRVPAVQRTPPHPAHPPTAFIQRIPAQRSSTVGVQRPAEGRPLGHGGGQDEVLEAGQGEDHRVLVVGQVVRCGHGPVQGHEPGGTAPGVRERGEGDRPQGGRGPAPVTHQGWAAARK